MPSRTLSASSLAHEQWNISGIYCSLGSLENKNVSRNVFWLTYLLLRSYRSFSWHGKNNFSQDIGMPLRAIPGEFYCSFNLLVSKRTSWVDFIKVVNVLDCSKLRRFAQKINFPWDFLTVLQLHSRAIKFSSRLHWRLPCLWGCIDGSVLLKVTNFQGIQHLCLSLLEDKKLLAGISAYWKCYCKRFFLAIGALLQLISCPGKLEISKHSCKLNLT